MEWWRRAGGQGGRDRFRRGLDEQNSAQNVAAMVESSREHKVGTAAWIFTKSTRVSSLAGRVRHDEGGEKKQRVSVCSSPPATDWFCSWSHVLPASCGMTWCVPFFFFFLLLVFFILNPCTRPQARRDGGLVGVVAFAQSLICSQRSGRGNSDS